MSKIKVLILSKMPAPYKVPVYERLNKESNIDLYVVYQSKKEPDREWNIDPGSFKHVFLRHRVLSIRNKFVHFNFSVVSELFRVKPDVVITNGYNPTDILALGYCILTRTKHISQTDGTLESERELSSIHRGIRRLASLFTNAYIGPSLGYVELISSYGVAKSKIFISPLAVDNERFAPKNIRVKKFDLLFSSRFVKLKNPMFALLVAEKLAYRLGRNVSICFLGSGELLEEIQLASKTIKNVDSTFAGFIQQEHLSDWYQSSKIFLFPTSWEPWGLVSNEAAASGLPILTTPIAGCAGEIVIDGVNGFVIDLDIETWAQKAMFLIENDELLQQYSDAGMEIVKRYNFEKSASGFIDAIRFA